MIYHFFCHKQWKQWQILFSWAPKITADGERSHEIKRLAPWKKSYGKPRQHIKKQRHHFADKGPYNQSYGFSNSHIELWELYYKEGWVPKNWCFWTVVVLEKTLESPLDWKEIKPVNPKGNQPWIFIGRTDAQASASIFWPSDAKRNSLVKTLMLGKIESRRRRGNKGRDGWMASPTHWTWIWANSRR